MIAVGAQYIVVADRLETVGSDANSGFCPEKMSPRTQSDTKLVEPMQTGLEILSWSFWSPETRQPQDWPAVSPVVEPPAVLGAQIPPAHRRRMSTLSKMAVQVALEATAGARPDF